MKKKRFSEPQSVVIPREVDIGGNNWPAALNQSIESTRQPGLPGSI